MAVVAAVRDGKFWLRTILGSIAILAGVIGVLVLIAYIKMRQVEAAMSAPPPPESPVAVHFAKAEATTFRRSSVVVGTVLAPESIVLRTELAGAVTEVAMQPGGTVEKGDLLVKLDDRTEQARLKRAEAALKLAESELVRARRLTAANANSASELDIAEAERTRAESEVEELRVMIDKKTMRSPFRARVGLFDLHVGEYLVEGTEITTLEGVSDYVHVDFSMPAHVADAVAIGEEVKLRVGEAAEPMTANIIALDASANSISRAMIARAKLQSPPVWLQPQDSIHVTVSYGQTIDAVAIPSTAVRRGPTGTIVFVVGEVEGQQRAVPLDVVVAGGRGPFVYVLKGLNAGEQVVTDGSFKVYQGALLADVSVSSQDPGDIPSETVVVDSGENELNAANETESTP